MRDGRDDPGREDHDVGVDGLSAADATGPEDSAEIADDSGATERLTVTLDPRSGIWIVAGILTVTLLAAFFEVTRRSMTIIGVGVLLAFAVEPLVLAVQRRARCGRGAAVGAVGTGLALAFAVLAVIVGPAAVQQAQDFGEELPSTLQEIEQLPVVGPRLEDADFAMRTEDWVDGLPGRLDTDGVETAARSVLNGALNGLGVLLVALVVLIDGPSLVARLRLVVPHRHRERADAVGRVFYRVVGTYFAGSLFVATIGGTWVLVVGLLVGVPLAPVAAVWYAVVSLIPQIGGFLGTSFVTILALTQGVVPALIVLVLVVAYMNLENYVITPAIVGEAVDLSPPVTMLAALVGGAAAGVPGALAATPLCGTIKAVYMEARYGEVPPAPTRMRVGAPAPLLRALGRARHDRGGDEEKVGDALYDPDVVVVGAGLGGLAAARDLVRAGRAVTVVEARDRVGGRIVNHTFDDGTVVEIGGQWVGPTQNRILALAADVEVATFPTYDTGELVTARNGRTIRHRSPTFGLPAAAVVELAASQPLLDRLAARVDLDRPWMTRGAERLDATTFETWIRRHHRTPAAQGFWRLAIEAVFACEPCDVSLLHVAFYLHSGGSLDRLLATGRGAQQDRFVGGSATVAERVAAGLRDDGVELRLGAPVRAIAQDDDGVVVRHDGGEVRAHRAIVAVPPTLAGRIAWSPILPPRRDQLLQKMPMGSVIKCLVRYDRPFWRDDGLCGQAAAIDDTVTITFDNTPPDEGAPGVLVAFLEGDHARRAADLSPAGREREVVRSLTRYFGPEAGRHTAYAELDWAAEEWTRGCYGAHLAPGVWTAFGDLLREPWGRVHWAGTETAAVWNGYMDGAVSSGERAATEVLAALPVGG